MGFWALRLLSGSWRGCSDCEVFWISQGMEVLMGLFLGNIWEIYGKYMGNIWKLLNIKLW